MRNAVMTLSALLIVAGCDKPVAAPAAKPSSAQPPLPPPPVEGVARRVKEKTDLYEFDYSYPTAASAIPKLKAWLEADLDQRKAELAKGAEEDRKQAAAAGFPYRPHSASAEWKVVTDLPGWLSLSTILASYTGGAHGNYAFDAVLWDKAAGERREVADLFTAKAALAAAIRGPFCDALDAQREKKRGAKIDRASGDEFDQCIDPLESALILGSSNGRTFDRIGVLVSPYAAGPYVEGNYEITLPLTEPLIAAVKPQYRASFAAGR